MRIAGIEITHISSCVPKSVEHVEDLSCLDNPERFSKTTGIKSRRIADENTLVSDLIISACNSILLNDASLDSTDIDVVVVITQSGDNTAPGVALKLHDSLGLKENCICFDINLGCSSYPYGMSVVGSLLKTLNLKVGLLCIGDISSKLCDVNDPSTYPLFGDAGSCTVIQNTGSSELLFNLYSDGSGRNDIIIPSASLASEFPPCNINFEAGLKNYSNMSLNGANVFSFAISKAPLSIKNLINDYDLNVSHIFLHQANKKINNFIEKKLSLENVVFPTSIENFGNTSSVSIPLTLSYYFSESSVFNLINKKIICCGFGVGLSWGSVYFELTNAKVYGVTEYE